MEAVQPAKVNTGGHPMQNTPTLKLVQYKCETYHCSRSCTATLSHITTVRGVAAIGGAAKWKTLGIGDKA